MPLITLTTDFGTDDPFVGLMKGAILAIAPGTVVVDLSHSVPPQDILGAGFVLESALGVFPPGTIHVGVVDPGVGTDRAAIAIRTDDAILVGPDNGLFTAVLARSPLRTAVRLTDRRFHRPAASATFHGRDIFGPVAAHLATGVRLEDLGEPLGQPSLIRLPEPRSEGPALCAHVVWVDRFGNLITDLGAEALARWAGYRAPGGIILTVGSTKIRGLHDTFGDVREGRCVAYLGSLGRLEIAVRNGDAARTLGAARGTVVRLEPSPA